MSASYEFTGPLHVVCKCHACEGVLKMSDEFKIAAVSYRALHLKYCALEGEMLVLKDQLTCALLEARENFEIANEFKHLMEEYRQREAAAHIALREAAGLLSTTPKFSCETPEYVMEYLLNAPREKTVDKADYELEFDENFILQKEKDGKRKPLTEAYIDALCDEFLLWQIEPVGVSGIHKLIRAVEKAHGIGEKE